MFFFESGRKAEAFDAITQILAEHNRAVAELHRMASLSANGEKEKAVAAKALLTLQALTLKYVQKVATVSQEFS